MSGGPIPRALVHDSGRSCSRITTPNGRLVYAGRAGTGMPVAELERVWRRLRPLVIDRMPLSAPPPRNSRFGSPLVLSRIHWVCPKMVVEVSYAEWTPDGLLRHVVYLGEREDKLAIMREETDPHPMKCKEGGGRQRRP